MDGSRLRVVRGAAPVSLDDLSDPDVFQARCVEEYVASQLARGFSPVTIENGTGVLERMLGLLGRPAWQVTREDVDRVVGDLAAQGIAASTRRGYLQAFKGFHGFLVARKAAVIEATFGARLESPLDEFNAARHMADQLPVAPP